MKGSPTASTASRSAMLLWVRAPEIEDEEGDAVAPGLVHALDQDMLGVALKRGELVAGFLCQRRRTPLDSLERFGTVKLWLPASQEVQIWPI